MRIRDILNEATVKLKNSCPRPRFEAELLLAHFLKKDRVYLHIFDNIELENYQEFFKLIERRANFEPLEYIIGEVSFYDITLKIRKGVLIPRPETEILIDRVSEIIERENIKNIIEVGVGSGAISIVLARKFPNLKILATDISDSAIELARENIKEFGLENRVKVIKRNIIDEVDTSNIDLVVSNPPYIANSFKLEPNVVNYEPKEALFGGERGDELLKKIILDVKRRGIKYLACEIGYDQREPLEEFFKQERVKYFKFYRDLAGLNRGFIVKFKEK